MSTARSKKKISPRRRALLGKVHIAKRDLKILDGDYRDILMQEFKVKSAADLPEHKLKGLLEYFQEKGWKPKRSHRPKVAEKEKEAARVKALKKRAEQIVLESDLDTKRWRGLVKKICGVDNLQWCGDAVRLKRLLAVINDMQNRGTI